MTVMVTLAVADSWRSSRTVTVYHLGDFPPALSTFEAIEAPIRQPVR
jgi:hypothetical protein